MKFLSSYTPISMLLTCCALACSSGGDSADAGASSSAATPETSGSSGAKASSGAGGTSTTAGRTATSATTSAQGASSTGSAGAKSAGSAPAAAAGTSAAAGSGDGAAAGSGNAEAAVGGSTGAAGVAGVAGVAGMQGAAGAQGATGATEDPTAACKAALKPACEMREKSACSSVKTVNVIDKVKAVEIPLGPYGAIMDQNVGQGFEIPEESGEANCDVVAASFGEPEETTKNIADLRDVDLKLYTVYRPACMREGEKYPVITWGNGTCGQTEGYGSLLRYVASYGYIVFASNSRYTGGNGAMTKALDFAEAANKDEKSIYFNRLNLDTIGAMGHSQGGMATITAASDPRIDSLIIWNGGSDASKPFLAVSGDTDIGSPTASSLKNAVEKSAQPSAWLFYHMVPQTGSVSGHLTLMIQPERVVEATVAWWDYQLKGDMKARDFFVGDNCGLCNKDAEFEYGAHSLK